MIWKEDDDEEKNNKARKIVPSASLTLCCWPLLCFALPQ